MKSVTALITAILTLFSHISYSEADEPLPAALTALAEFKWDQAKENFRQQKSSTEFAVELTDKISNAIQPNGPKSVAGTAEIERSLARLINIYNDAGQIKFQKSWDATFAGKNDPRVQLKQLADREFSFKQTLGTEVGGRLIFTREDHRRIDEFNDQKTARTKRFNKWRVELREPNESEQKLLSKNDNDRIQGLWVGKIRNPANGLFMEKILVVDVDGRNLRLMSPEGIVSAFEVDLKRIEPEINQQKGLASWWGQLRMDPLPMVNEDTFDHWYLYQPEANGNQETFCVRCGPAVGNSSTIARYQPREFELIMYRDKHIRGLDAVLKKLRSVSLVQQITGDWKLAEVNNSRLSQKRMVDFQFNYQTVRKILVAKNQERVTNRIVQSIVYSNIQRQGDVVSGWIDWGLKGQLQKGIFKVSSGEMIIHLAQATKTRPEDYHLDTANSKLMVFRRADQLDNRTSKLLQSNQPMASGDEYAGSITVGEKTSEINLKILSVNGKRFTAESLRDSIRFSVEGRIDRDRIEFDEIQFLDNANENNHSVFRYSGIISESKGISGTCSMKRKRGQFQLDKKTR